MSDISYGQLTLSESKGILRTCEVPVTDGPFKNLKLGSCWKLLADAVQNDAVASTECVAFASHGLVRDLTTAENLSALTALEACSQNQLNFDPVASVDAIFEACAKTPFLDTFHKQMQFRVANGTSLAKAIPQALNATIEGQIGEARNRFVEELLYARDTHKMNQKACQRALDKINAAFHGVDRQSVHDAFCAGNRNAFKNAASKKEGLEEGPRL